MPPPSRRPGRAPRAGRSPGRPAEGRSAKGRPPGTQGRRLPGRGRIAGTRPAAAGTGSAARRVPGGLTGRAGVLGLVVCALVLSLAYPMKQYLAQRGDIAQLERQKRTAQAQVSALEERKRQLSDPAYVRSQARKRLQYVLPGETVYVVPGVPEPSPAAAPATAPAEVGTERSWYGRLWGSVRAADGAPAP